LIIRQRSRAPFGHYGAGNACHFAPENQAAALHTAHEADPKISWKIRELRREFGMLGPSDARLARLASAITNLNNLSIVNFVKYFSFRINII
jgi:hypothetical protein